MLILFILYIMFQDFQLPVAKKSKPNEVHSSGPSTSGVIVEVRLRTHTHFHGIVNVCVADPDP